MLDPAHATFFEVKIQTSKISNTDQKQIFQWMGFKSLVIKDDSTVPKQILTCFKEARSSKCTPAASHIHCRTWIKTEQNQNFSWKFASECSIQSMFDSVTIPHLLGFYKAHKAASISAKKTHNKRMVLQSCMCSFKHHCCFSWVCSCLWHFVFMSSFGFALLWTCQCMYLSLCVCVCVCVCLLLEVLPPLSATLNNSSVSPLVSYPVAFSILPLMHWPVKNPD